MFGKRSKDDGNTPLKSRKQIHSKTPLAANMAANLQTLSEKLGGSSDFVIRQLRCDAMPGVEMAVAYIKGIVEEETIHDNVVNPVMSWSAPLGKGSWTETLRQRIVTTGYTKPVSLVEDALNKLLDGECLIFTNGLREAVAADTSGGEQRSVAEPNTQTVIRGPQYSFTENISTNVGLLRRIIRSPDFRIRTYTVGRKTRTRVELLYVHNIANPKVVEEIDKRIRDIDIDGILESNYIEEFISDQTFTPFPTMMNTERPDTAAAAMLDGQLIILVDGTPFVLVGPATFFSFFSLGGGQLPAIRYFNVSAAASVLRVSCVRYSAVALYCHYDLPSGNAADDAAH